MDGSVPSPITGTNVYDTGDTVLPYSHINASGTMSGTCTSHGTVTASYSLGDTTGTLTLTEKYTSSYDGNEPYGYSIMGGSVSGSIHESGNSTTSYSTTYLLGKDGSGEWCVSSATGHDSIDQHDSLSYTGGGSFTDSGTGYSFNGTVTASGRRNSGSGSTFDYTLTNGVWVQTNATGYGNMDNGDDCKSGGTGTYTLTDAGESGGGTTYGSDWGGWSSSGNWTLTGDAAGGWSLTSGSGTTKAYGGYNNGFQDNGNNIYQVQTDTDTGSGTITDNGLQKYSLNYTINHNVQNGAWQNTGSGIGSFENRRHWNYKGSGTYLTSVFLGDWGEHGGYNLDASGNWNIALGTDGVWNLSGGTSAYDLSDDGTAWWQGDGQYDTTTTSGTLKDDALNTYLVGVHTTSSVANGAWITTGNSTYSASGHDKQTYKGDGQYSNNVGVIVSGTTSESGLRNSSYDFNAKGTLANGAWTYTGGGFNQSEMSDTYGYDGGGSSSVSHQQNSSGSGGYSNSSDSTVTTMDENGDFTRSVVFRQDFGLAADGSSWLLNRLTTTNHQTASAFSDRTTELNQASSYGTTVAYGSGPTSSTGWTSRSTESMTDYSADRTQTTTTQFVAGGPPIVTNGVSGGGSGSTYSLDDSQGASSQTMGNGAAVVQTSSWSLIGSDLGYGWTYATAGDSSTANGTVTNEGGSTSDVWSGGQHVVHYVTQTGGTAPVTNSPMWMGVNLETTRGTFNGQSIGGWVPGVTYTPGAADDGLEFSPDGATPCASGGGSSGSGATTQPTTQPTTRKYAVYVMGGVGYTNQLSGSKGTMNAVRSYLADSSSRFFSGMQITGRSFLNACAELGSTRVTRQYDKMTKDQLKALLQTGNVEKLYIMAHSAQGEGDPDFAGFWINDKEFVSASEVERWCKGITSIREVMLRSCCQGTPGNVQTWRQAFNLSSGDTFVAPSVPDSALRPNPETPTH